MVEDNAYKRGFQGQLRDDEIYGSGNSYTANYWQYDSRLGRRWNTDPVVYPWQSSYATFNNNPIIFTDHDGRVAKRKGGSAKGRKAGKTGFGLLWRKFKNRLKNGWSGLKEGLGKAFQKRNKSQNQEPTYEIDLDEVVISAERTESKPLEDEMYYTLTTDDADYTHQAPDDDPTKIPTRYLDVSVVSDLNFYVDRWRRLKIPSFDITDFLGNVSAMISELVSSDAKPALDSPDEKEVKESTKKAADDNHKKVELVKKDTSVNYIPNNEDGFDTLNIIEREVDVNTGEIIDAKYLKKSDL